MSSHRHLRALAWSVPLVLLAAWWFSSGPGPQSSATEEEKKVQPTATSLKAPPEALMKEVTQGALRIVGKDDTVIECPLEHTDVQAEISGFIARVKVTQTFRNPTSERIEAVYVFPLPHQAAVDDMTMVIGPRRIVGVIKRREEARQIYEQALLAGQTAALLEQERPNIFTQSVGNIDPGQEVNIEISYVDVLKYDMGTYEFHFPMVVGPRYNPRPSPGLPGVPDAQRINPPVLRPGQRSGHDISLAVNLDAGVPIQNLVVANHRVRLERRGKRQARIRLLQEDSIPNKDFVLRYDVVGERPEMALLAHTGDYSRDAARLGRGYFMLMIQPKEDEKLKKSPPREVVFLVDVSGSMSGQPTAKVREAMRQMLKLCRPKDTVQVITFASMAHQLFDRPVPVTEANIQRALSFTGNLRGGGGTEMLKGVKMAIDQPVDPKRVRIVVMLTDGYIGNEAQIIEHVGRHCGDRIRFWAIGIGQAPNMFLIDGVARQGGGMGKKLGLNDDTTALTQEVMTRIQRAQLADISIDWGKLQVAETYPARLPELWAGRPVIVYGRYQGSGTAEITIRGKVEGEPVSWPLRVTLPKEEPQHDVLAKVWARQKIEELMHQTFYQGSPAIEEAVTAIALDYRLMSQYTSFVAVDEQSARQLGEAARPPRQMLVPVPLPEGTRWEGFFGEGSLGVPAVALGGERLAREAAAAPAVPLLAGKALAKTPTGLSRKSEAADRLSFALPYSGEKSRGNAAGSPALNAARQVYRRGVVAATVPTAPSSTISGPLPALAPPAGGGAFGGGFGGVAGRAAVEAVQTESAESIGVAARGQLAALSKDAQKSAEAARAALEQARKAHAGHDIAAARAACLRAVLLDQAAVEFGRSDGQSVAEALALLEKLHSEQLQQYKKQLPALDKKLDLIVRNRSIQQALDQIAKAAGIKIQIAPGSLDDARSMMLDDRLLVSYLDLRHATVAQALDWITRPARLQWSLDGGRVVVTSARRTEGQWPWVYDVSVIALPLDDELQKAGDYNQVIEKVRRLSDQFITAVRRSCGLDEKSVVWFGPGQLLVLGSPQKHQRVAQLLKTLADADARPPAAAAALHPTTVRRAKERVKEVAKYQAARRRQLVAMSHEQFGWQLLATAAAGQLDLEALTELQIAWSDPTTDALLKSEAAAVVLRSAWIIREAAGALPDEPELEQLAEIAATRSQAAARQALDRLGKRPKDQTALAQVVFAALAGRNETRADKEYTARALPLIRQADAALGTVTEALLGTAPRRQAAALAKLAEEGVAGDDRVVLTALACRRAGGAAWRALRANARELLGKQPLSGHVVLLVNQLDSPQLQIARAGD